MSNLENLTVNSTGYPDGEQPGSTVALVIFMTVVLVLIVATVLSNSAVCVVVYAFRELRTVTNYFVLSLATADIVVAMVAMPVWLVSGLLEGSDTLWLSTQWVDAFCCSASIASATLVSIDRYYAINWPLHYKTVITARFAKRAIAAVWGFAVFVAALSFLRYHPNSSVEKAYIVFLFVTLFCIPLAVMSFTYSSIYKAAIAQIAKMDSMGQNGSRSARYDRRKKFYKELRITKTLLVIVMLFLICWSPFLIVTLMEAFTPQHEIPLAVQGVIVWLPYLLSCANPWIYTGMTRDFRKSFKLLFCSTENCCRCYRREAGRRCSSTMEDHTLTSNVSRRNGPPRKTVTVL